MVSSLWINGADYKQPSVLNIKEIPPADMFNSLQFVLGFAAYK